MFCAITGQTPDIPIVSKKSGHIFEKRIIEKYLSETGKCPITDEELTEDDLVEVKVAESAGVKPRLNSTMSVPGLLALLQNEWDATMLETFSLRKHVDTIRQELSHALYQHDAACRVIARLMKERDESRLALSNTQKQLSSMAASGLSEEPMSAEATIPRPGQLSEEVLNKITECSTNLSAERKKRRSHVSPNLASEEVVTAMKLRSSHPIHKSTTPGITCVAFDKRNSNLVATGGNDSDVQIFDHVDQKVVATLSGHSAGQITSVAFHNQEDIVVSSSADSTCRIWKRQADEYITAHLLDTHSGYSVTGASLHPSGAYLALGSLDKTWSMHDIETGSLLSQSVADDSEAGYSCISYHPDGVILGTGSESNVLQIWELKTGQNVANFEGHTGKITGIAFSNNGYYLASSSVDGTVRLWDLRKQTNFKTIEPSEDSVPVEAVAFDWSGWYLAVAQGNVVKTYRSRSWKELSTLEEHTMPVTGLAWGTDASVLASTSLDRTLRLWT